MYLKATNRSGSTSNEIPATSSGIIPEGFSIRRDADGLIDQIKLSDPDFNPFSTTDVSIAVSAGVRPDSGSLEFTDAFVDAATNLEVRVELIRPETHSGTDVGFIFNRGSASLSSTNRRTQAQLNALVESDDTALTSNLGAVGTQFRIVDANGVVLSRAFTITSIDDGGSFAWVTTDGLADDADIQYMFFDNEISIESDLDVVEPTGTFWYVQVLSNQTATDGTGIWELIGDNNQIMASN